MVALRALLGRYPDDLARHHPVWQVVRAGRSLLVTDIAPAVGDEWFFDAEQRVHNDALGPHLSLLVVPIEARGERLGTLGLQTTAHSGRRLGPEDLALAEELGRRAGLAIDNARLYAEAQQALRVRDEFLASVSHDLKTPLTAIKGLAQLVARRLRRAHGDAAERNLRALSGIDAAVARMEHLVAELLDVGRFQSGQPPTLDRSPTDLVALARHGIETLREMAPRHHLSLETELTELVGVFDRPRLERVLENLLSNAVKYSPAGGAIVVRVAREQRDGAAWAVLSVRDCGIGVPASDLPHIFDRFHRGANVSGQIAGTGLGLFGSQQIVAQHGGTITAASDEGAGSTFTVHLPLDG